MSVKLSETPGYLEVSNDAGGISLHRHIARVVVAAIDAGHLDALRHYAEHGTLPVEPPVWKPMKVSALSSGDGWSVINGDVRIATVRKHERWTVTLHLLHPQYAYSGDTPQDAVDKAIVDMARLWGLQCV